MKSLAAVLAIAALLAACTDGADVDLAPASGIQGQALLGPVCPVVHLDTPCPDRPYQATIDVWNAARTERVTTFTTDDQGRFRVPLPPGDYFIDPQPPRPGVPPSPIPQAVTVPPDRFLDVTIEYDSGIR